jgi:ATP-binding cassette subfamily F protein 3
MREALAQALVDFEGGLIVVAHDRHLLSAATDQWMLVADGRVQPFEGGLEDYKEWAREYHSRGRRGEAAAEAKATRKDERRTEALERQKRAATRRPMEKRVAAIDAELAALGAEAREADAWLASAEAYAPEGRERLEATLKRRAEVARAIEDLELEWLRVSAALDKQ